MLFLLNKERPAFIIELGNFKDQDKVPDKINTISYLKEIEKTFQSFDEPVYHVLGTDRSIYTG